MPYPSHIEEKLEFNQIRELLLSKCISELGQSYVHKIKFTNRFDLLEKWLLQTREFKELLQQDTPFPSEHYYDLEASFKKASIEGLFLVEEEWHQLKWMLRTFEQVCRYFEERADKYVRLFELFGGITVNTALVKQIDRILDENGKLKPNASPELGRISASIADKEKEIRRRLNKVFEQASAQGWLADSGITVRDGRLVIPVLAEFKRNVPGFVHDESATGQTVFIEPSEAFDNNNALRELQIAFRREREKILRELTDKLRPDIPELRQYAAKLGQADFLRAKALLAIELKSNMPLLLKGPTLKLERAYHPLLRINHERQGLPVVPLHIQLTPEKRILVISGPNAGGKSVCLKTTGLLQYMLQCGLLIPCEAHSEVGIFQDILVDIGDEQSIENDLSTYSSHLKHMKYFTDFADSRTLFLIDEFGTGTDPQFGGPLAEAILNRLNQKNACGVVTTHYSNLKVFASNTKGLENACMLFDNQNLIPLYELEMGKPGSSYAFEIAQKTGLMKPIIDEAKLKVGDKQKRVDDLLIDLEREKRKVTELKASLEKKEKEAAALAESYGTLKTELEANRKNLIREAKQEALQIINDANSRIEQTIREIKEKKADTEAIRKVKQELRTETEQIKSHLPQVNQKPVEQTPGKEIRVGATVTISGQSEAGEVEEIRKQKALVAFNGFRTWVELNRLVPAKKTKQKITSPASGQLDLNHKMKSFSTELNLIGVRGEEALKQLQTYLDDAYLLGFKQVRIVHGKGYGILRNLIRDYLRKSKVIERMEDEHIEMGGDGVTIVTLKL